MFNELTKLFGGQRKERRQFPRKKARFNVSWIRQIPGAQGELIPGIGMELSLNGCLFATKTPPAEKQFDVVLDLGGNRKIRLRLNTARSGTILRENQQWTFLGCSFSGVAADDYDALVRFMKDIPEAENRAVKELAAMDKTDDAYRLLPMRVQQRVLDALVRIGRLEMPVGNQQPLLRMSSLGMDKGRQRVAVHSRIPGVAGEEPQAFDSILLIDDTGAVKVES